MLGTFSGAMPNVQRKPLPAISDASVDGIRYSFDAKSSYFQDSVTVGHGENLNTGTIPVKYTTDAEYTNLMDTLTQQSATSRIAYTKTVGGVYRPAITVKSVGGQVLPKAEFNLHNPADSNGYTNWFFYAVISAPDMVGNALNIMQFRQDHMSVSMMASLTNYGGVRFSYLFQDGANGTGTWRSVPDGGADIAGADAGYSDPDSVFLFIFTRSNSLGVKARCINLANMASMYYNNTPNSSSFYDGDGSFTVSGDNSSRMLSERSWITLAGTAGTVSTGVTIDWNLHECGIVSGAVGGAESNLIDILRRKWWYGESAD